MPDDAQLLDLLSARYAEEPYLAHYRSETETALRYCRESGSITYTPFRTMDAGGSALLAHAALIEDARLRNGEAFFGFVEMGDDADAALQLWRALTDAARATGIHTLKGPMQGSIWHQYRAVKETDGSPFFPTEPFGNVDLYRFLSSLEPSEEISYLSARRRDIAQVLDLLPAIGSTIEVRRETDLSLATLMRIAELSKAAFSGSWAYTELSPAEFSALYPAQKLASHGTRLYGAYDGEELMGFLSAFDAGDARVLKTIAVDERYRGRGIGSALARIAHEDAVADGKREMVYALMREGNAISHFPTEGVEIFRRYAAFSFSL